MGDQRVTDAIRALAAGNHAEIIDSDDGADLEAEGVIVVPLADVEAVLIEPAAVDKAAVPMERHPICFYHRDTDGLVSAAIVGTVREAVEFKSIQYKEPFPMDAVDRASEIWMVDFALQPFDLMIELRDRCKAAGVPLVWIDHHQSSLKAAEAAEFKVAGKREIGDGACALVWSFCHGSEPPPVVRMTARHDVWNFDDDRTEPVFLAVEDLALKPDSEEWAALFARGDDDLGDLLADGKVIADKRREMSAKIMSKRAFEVEFEGMSAVVAQSTLPGSRQFDTKAEGHDVAIRLSWSSKSALWTVTMYALREGLDVAEVAEKYGGGGHAEAAGFQVEELPFDVPADKVDLPDRRAEAALKAAEAVVMAPIAKAADDEPERFTLGVVLEPNDGADGAPLDPDTQGDIYSADEIRKAQRLYMAKFQQIGRQHGSLFASGDAVLVDCFIVPMESAGLDVALPDGTTHHIRPGTWLQGVQWSPRIWSLIQAGKFTGWSIGGDGYRTPIDA